MKIKTLCMLVFILSITACRNTNYLPDQDWENMSAEDKRLNDLRNECALEDNRNCIIWSND